MCTLVSFSGPDERQSVQVDVAVQGLPKVELLGMLVNSASGILSDVKVRSDSMTESWKRLNQTASRLNTMKIAVR